MKAHLDIQHTGTLGDDDRHRMSFDEESVTHLMGVLTDLYSDREKAVAREYITNAIDSHAAAGITDPVEVTLPTAFSPTFVVKDHGVGMSVDQIINQYSKYGYSSKRESDAQVGMLGLGCKSALTYTSQFTLTARKDGREAVVLITRDADGCGVVQIISESDTTLPNGVEVSIPVKDRHSFCTKVREFAYYCDPGVLLLDGLAPACIWLGHRENDPTSNWSELKVIDPDIIIIPNGHQDLLVMGNVAYPIVSDFEMLRADYYNRSSVVARVPIGTVNFTPSREELRYTKRTKDTIEELKSFVLKHIMTAAQKDVADAPTALKALDRAAKWRPVLNALDPSTYGKTRGPVSSPFKWDYNVVPLGREHLVTQYVPDEYTKDGYQVEAPNTPRIWRWDSYGDIRSQSDCRVHAIPVNPGDRNYVSNMDRLILVTGFTLENVTRSVKLKTQKWLEENIPADKFGRRPHYQFYFYNKTTRPLVWWDEVRIVPFADIQKMELEVKQKRKPSDPPVYRWFTHPSGVLAERPMADEDKDKRILISTTNQPYRLVDAMPTIFELYGPKKGVPIVRLPMPQIAKFKELYPKAELIEDALRADLKTFADSITEAEWFMYWSESQVYTTHLLRLDPKKVSDPELKAVVLSYRKVRDNVVYLIRCWDAIAKALMEPTLIPSSSTARQKVRSQKKDLGLRRMEDLYPMIRFFDPHKIDYQYDEHGRRRKVQPSDVMLHEYVNALYLLRCQRHAAWKAEMARLGRIGRRRKVRLLNAKKRSDRLDKVKSERAKRAIAMRRMVERANQRRHEEKAYREMQQKRAAQRAHIKALVAAQEAREEAEAKKKALQQVGHLIHLHQQQQIVTATSTPSPIVSQYSMITPTITP